MPTLILENEAVLDKPWTQRNGDKIWYESQDRNYQNGFQSAVTSPRTVKCIFKVTKHTYTGSYGLNADEGNFE